MCSTRLYRNNSTISTNVWATSVQKIFAVLTSGFLSWWRPDKRTSGRLHLQGVVYCPNDRNHDYRYDVITAPLVCVCVKNWSYGSTRLRMRRSPFIHRIPRCWNSIRYPTLNVHFKESRPTKVFYFSVSQTFFKWGPLLLVRMFYGPPYSCPLWK
jgi:hypothetical protein